MNIVKLHDNRITLINGDCLEVLPKVKTNTIDMVFADLPYGTTQNKWDSIIPLDTLWLQLKRTSKLTTPYVFTANGGFQFTLHTSNKENWKYDWVWEKEKGVGHLNAKIQPMRNHENILVFYREQCTYNPQFSTGIPYNGNARIGKTQQTTNYGTYNAIREDNDGKRYPKSVIKYTSVGRGGIHPTQKPVELLEYLIKTYTNANDVVLDPAAGSGTTAVACINTNRRCIAIEKDTELGYFDTMITRCNATIAELNNVK